MVTVRNILFDKDLSESSKYLGNLPEWNLNDLYTNTQSQELKNDLSWLEKECKSFSANFQGKLADLLPMENARSFCPIFKKKLLSTLPH